MPCLQPFRDDSAQLLLYKIASCLAEGGSVAGVASFNGLTGVVTFTGGDIITLLGFTPISESDGDARYVLKSGDTMTGALAIGNGVLVANDPVLELSQTWNNAAVAFTALKSDVTVTAAAAGSLLFDFQQNAGSIFNLRTDGRLVLNGRAAFTTTSSIGHLLAVSDALTASAVNGLSISHILSSGVAAAGLGINFDFLGDSTTTTGQRIARISGTWTTATHATRTGSLSITIPELGVDTVMFVLANSQLQSRGGSVSAPALTVQGDLDTGIYWPAANTLGVTVGGGLVLSASATTGIIVSTSLTLPYVAKVATYTASAVDYTIDCTAGTFDVDLPTAVGITGRIYVIKNSGVGTITIDPDGAELIDSLATATVVSGGATMVQSNGVGWIII